MLLSAAVNADLALALSLADAADQITMRHFRSASLSVRAKADTTPVSEADEATERMIRERLARERPHDAIVGEEFGSEGTTARRWIIDPIDATKNYIRGVPVFATLIALEESGAGTIAVVSAPALQRRWWAERGAGAFCNGQPIRVSSIDDVRDVFLGYDTTPDEPPAYRTLLASCGRTRGFGDFWMHMLVAEGAMDAAIDPVVSHWDMAAIQVIVEEAGGRFTTLDGEARADGGSGVSTNGRVHDAILAVLARSP